MNIAWLLVLVFSFWVNVAQGSYLLDSCTTAHLPRSLGLWSGFRYEAWELCGLGCFAVVSFGLHNWGTESSGTSLPIGGKSIAERFFPARCALLGLCPGAAVEGQFTLLHLYEA